jgi:hypothetical protein
MIWCWKPPGRRRPKSSTCCAGILARSADHWQVSFDVRVGIAEFDCGLPRPEAEAFACCSSSG